MQHVLAVVQMHNHFVVIIAINKALSVHHKHKRPDWNVSADFTEKALHLPNLLWLRWQPLACDCRDHKTWPMFEIFSTFLNHGGGEGGREGGWVFKYGPGLASLLKGTNESAQAQDF